MKKLLCWIGLHRWRFYCSWEEAKSAYLVEIGVRGEQRDGFIKQLSEAVEQAKRTRGALCLGLALPPGSMVHVNGRNITENPR